jgi:hypothetical protein
LIEFLSEIATFQNALQYERLDSWKPSDIDLKFKAEEIKTAEEWYSAGKISELAMEMIISSENQELDYIKWWGIEISGKFYYSLSCLKDIKDRLKVEEATQVALSINNKI